MDGEAPIDHVAFLTSKYLIILVWAITVLHNWGIDINFYRSPVSVNPPALILWVIGFSLLFIGRFTMGDSFRIGSPREETGLKVNGLFKISRNPIYLGVFTTLTASVLDTLNPIILLIVIFIIVVHHHIVLAEEEFLKKSFGEEYLAYCSKVRRYI